MKKIAFAIVGTVALSGAAFAQTVPAEPQGCHGAATVAYKNSVSDAGGQGSAIGGKGKSDGNATNGQAHSDPGRGAQLQDFLATNCQVGSQAPN